MIDDIIDSILGFGLSTIEVLKRFLTAKKDDDKYDRFSSRITPFILIVISIFMVIAQFIIKPVVCWCPTHFTDAHVSYSNSYCWVKNTYYLPYHREIPKKEDPHDYLQYYQFTIFIVIAQAILYYLPSFVWHGINSKAGIDADDVLHRAEELSCLSNKSSSNADDKLKHIVSRFKYLADSKKYDHEYKNGKLKRCCIGFLHLTEGSFNGYLVLAFMVTKLLYIANAIGQFWLMNVILFKSFNTYGFDVLGNMAADHNWNKSPLVVFPRVTMCDIEARRLGNVHRYTLQCTLPLNFLNEKIFLFIWFWMAIVAAVTVFGFFQWTVRILWPGDDYQFVSNHLPLIDLDQTESRNRLQTFINKYLRVDGIFLLRLISHNTNTLTTNDIANALWEKWELDLDSTSNHS